VNASATNRQPEPTTDQGQSPPPLPEGVSWGDAADRPLPRRPRDALPRLIPTL